MNLLRGNNILNDINIITLWVILQIAIIVLYDRFRGFFDNLFL